MVAIDILSKIGPKVTRKTWVKVTGVAVTAETGPTGKPPPFFSKLQRTGIAM